VVIWAVLAVVLAAALYWTVRIDRPALQAGVRPSAAVIVLTGLALALVVWSAYLDRPSYTYSTADNTAAIAVAFDLSPSMLARPDPTLYPDVPPRYVRGKDVLNGLFRTLEDRQEDIVVSLIGFTRRAGVIMGWDSNVSQVREMLAYGLSPDLFTSTGTSMEEGVKSLAHTFDNLPEKLRETSRKIAILVSDGEDTAPTSYLSYALEALRTKPIAVIALQTGLLNTEEGVPRYGEVGEFKGFEQIGGRLYTAPDVDAMTQVSRSSSRGLYVRAEDPEAVDKILGFIGDERASTGNELEKVGVITGLFLVVTLLLGRLLQ
jgi:hypothetical protein